ncbi:hypothetical protein NMG60_11012097 [Bertholletia excelsa]
MKSTCADKDHSRSWDSHVRHKNSKWLMENLEEVDQSIKAMLKLIEEGDSFAEKAGVNYERRPKLVAHVEGFCSKYKMLAECYDLLSKEVHENVLLSVVQMQDSDIPNPGSGLDLYMVTPDQKLGGNKYGQATIGSDFFPSSGGGSSDLSLKEGSEFSASASDYESDYFYSVSKQLSPYVTSDGKDQYSKIIEEGSGLPTMKKELDITQKENSVNSRTNLLKLVSEYEEELKKSNDKLLLSEQEVARLQSKLNNSETVNEVIGDLHCQLEDVRTKESELKMEKGRILELQKQVVELEAQLSGSNCKIWALTEELEVAKEMIKNSEDDTEFAQVDLAVLELKLNSKKEEVLELQGIIARHMAELSNRDQEIKDLNIALNDAQTAFTKEKAKLQSDISILSEEAALLRVTLEESEKQRKSLENDIRDRDTKEKEIKLLHEEQQIGLCSEIEHLKVDIAERGKLVETLNKNLDMQKLRFEESEAERKGMKLRHEEQQVALWSEIERFKAEVAQKSELVETLNKNFDILKLKHDMLMAEKETISAKLHSLVADLSSRDNQIQQLEEHLCHMRIELVELTSKSEGSHKLVGGLRLRVEELEKEVDKQRMLMLDRAEEKKEAIRQLCFSLEHYRSGYQELRRAFAGHKRCVILAS